MVESSSDETLLIAVDGPAASGKGTLSRRLAKHYGLNYLDTGSLYRAAAVVALDANVDLMDGTAVGDIGRTLDLSKVDPDRLRMEGVGAAASKIASMPELREALLYYQREFAKTVPGAVLDGRDIGSVVCPDADVKLFVTASLEERAKRRLAELSVTDPGLTYCEVLAQITLRDERDSLRTAAPLTRAPDAHLLDTTNLDIEAAMDAAVQFVDQAIAAKN